MFLLTNILTNTNIKTTKANYILGGVNMLEDLKKFAEKQGFQITYVDFGVNMQSLKGRKIGFISDKRILLNTEMKETDEAFVLAHEIAHGYLHKDKGDTTNSPKNKEYEEEANRAAELILDLLSLDNELSVRGVM